MAEEVCNGLSTCSAQYSELRIETLNLPVDPFASNLGKVERSLSTFERNEGVGGFGSVLPDKAIPGRVRNGVPRDGYRRLRIPHGGRNRRVELLEDDRLGVIGAREIDFVAKRSNSNVVFDA